LALWLALVPVATAENAAAPSMAQMSPEQLQLIGAKNTLLLRVDGWNVLLPQDSPLAGEFLPRFKALRDEAVAAGDRAGLEAMAPRLLALEAELRGALTPGSEKMSDIQLQAAYINIESKKAVLISLQRTRVRLDSAQQKRLDFVRGQVMSSDDPAALAVLYDRIRTYGPGDSPIVSAKAVDELAGALEQQNLPRAQLPAGLSARGSMEVPVSAPLAPADEAKAVAVAGKLGIPAGIVRTVVRESNRQGVDYRLVLAVIQAESAFDPNATSGVGARGLMQIMPDTGRGLGVSDPDSLYNVETNVRAGIRFLKQLWTRFTDFSWSHLQALNPFAHADVKKAVAAYNAGPGAVMKYGGVPPYRETQGYVVKVLRNYIDFRRQFSE
jgi:soluble lytic murein transglycosylase-like protein